MVVGTQTNHIFYYIRSIMRPAQSLNVCSNCNTTSWSFQINITEGFGAGILYPKTDTTLLGKERHDDYHISGYGLSAGLGLNITFLKHFFIQADLKGGYINMPNLKTSLSAADSASQSFYFLQNNILIGGKFRLF